MSYLDWNTFNENDFNSVAIELFRRQSKEVEVYKRFISNLEIDLDKISDVSQIPFLPVEFFKTDKVIGNSLDSQITFYSSSTTNTGQSRHFVADCALYRKAFINGFRLFYGNPKDFCFLCLLPSYLERDGSSLVFMAEELVKQSQYGQSGFFLQNFETLYKQLIENEKNKVPTILFGVSFALLDFAELYSINLEHTIVMETGGMKGRRAELPREAIHKTLMHAFGVSTIHSEYGMTELLSQAYSGGNGLFRCPPWMKVVLYNPHNPLSAFPNGVGGVNIIDLANIYSCSFIQTSDLGKIHKNGEFEILGRIDNSDIRGCNLLVV